MPGHPNNTHFNAGEYLDDWGEDPLFHQGPASSNGLAAKLTQIRARYSEEKLTDPRKFQMLTDIKTLYTTEPFNKLNLWPATRDWLIGTLQKHNLPINIVP